eukprot:c19730_g1_i1 orf=401-772(-)
MAVFTFVCRHDGDSWSAKQHGGELEGSASSQFELQRQLSNLALSSAGSGAISSSFSYVTPSAAVCQVIIGGGGGGGAFFGGGGGGGAPAASGGAGAPAAEEKKEEEKKEEEESDDDMGFSLFD